MAVGLNIELDGVARRLSFSPSPSPASSPPRPPRTTATRRSRFTLVTIPENDPREQRAPAPPPPWVSSPFPAPAPHTETNERPAVSLPPVSPPPVHTQIVPAPRAPPPQTQQQQVAAALGELERTRQAGVQQAWAEAQQQQQVAAALGELERTRQAGVQQAWAEAQQQQVAAALGELERTRQAGLQQAWEAAQQQQVAAALGELERTRQAGLQQAWAAAQQQQALASAFRGWDHRRQAQAALQQLWPLPQQEQRLRLYTVQGEPAGYTTKWEDIHPVSQRLLLQIEDKIREDRYASDKLDQFSCLYDPSVSNNSFQRDARQITQELGPISTIMDREKASVHSLMDVVKETMSTVEFAIGSYVKLRPWFVNRAGFANHAGSSAAHTDFSQPLTMGRTFHSSHGSVRRPSIFMQHLVDRFEKQLEECGKLIGELEQLVEMKNNQTYPASLETLPKVMSDMHDYFIYLASKVENLHQCAETIRIHHLNDLRKSGNRNDPFAEADRKEAAKQQAAARIVHPTLPIGDTGSRRPMFN